MVFGIQYEIAENEILSEGAGGGFVGKYLNPGQNRFEETLDCRENRMAELLEQLKK